MLGPAPENLETRDTESEIAHYLLKANLAMDAYKLTAPAHDNAHLYYQEIIKLDPDHQEAQQGLTEIAVRYADMAEHALVRYDYVNAKLYVREGLSVQPENPRLVTLQQRTNAMKDIPTRIIKGVKSVFE